MKMNPTYRLTTAGVTALTFALLIPSLPASAATSCESLASLRLPQTTITRYQMSFWDALVVHAAQSAGTPVLYSEDLSDGQLYGPVRVINPFTNDVRSL
jgi:hypothetical protein